MATPCVGIFWGCRGHDGSLVLLADKTPIDQAEQYGDCRTHPTGHAEFWEGLARLGASGLERRGLPTAPAWHQYETVPRGRVIYLVEERRFMIYLDPRLRGKMFVSKVVAEFCIPMARYELKADSHYRAVPDISQSQATDR